MRDALDLIDALFSWPGIWLVVSFLMGVGMQLTGLTLLVIAIARRTADMVRTARELRRRRLVARADDEGEWGIPSPPPGQ